MRRVRLPAFVRAWARRAGALGGASSETVSLVVTAIVVGVLAGLAAVAFHAAVNAADVFVSGLSDRIGGPAAVLATILFPALGGLAIGPIVTRWAPDARGSGIPHVMVAVSNLGGRVSRGLLVWRPIATVLSVGSGGSLGTEGPVVQLGAALASTLSRWWRLNDERRRNLVAVAAAGGIAATFNAPIAGVLFALEVILGQFQGRYFASVVIGAVSATAVSRSILGDAPAFAVPADYHMATPAELPYYLLLGVLAAGLAVAFIRVMVGSEDLLNRFQIRPWARPALGGLAVGVLTVGLPQVWGRGYGTTGGILNEEIAAPLLLALLVVGKMLATGASIGSWGAGGIFAPALLVGAAFGALFASVAGAVLPGPELRTGPFAVVGMAAVFSGVTRAPMSSIVMVFEISGSYDLILPLLLSAVIATLGADLLHPESFYKLMLSRRGLNLLSSRDIDLMQSVRVSEVMERDVPTVSESATLRELTDTLATSHHHGFVVTDRSDSERMVGVVTLADVEAARRDGRAPSDTVATICTRLPYVAVPDETASEVLERMGQLGIGRMPVVDRSRPDRPLGIVRQSDLARAYYMAVQRERSQERLQERLRLRDLTGQEIVEVTVPRTSALAGVRLRDARLPRESIVVAVRRDGRTLFPNGDTTLEPGDAVVANVAPGHGTRFRTRVTAPPEPPEPADAADSAQPSGAERRDDGPAPS